jgi:hypothetical protein
VRDPRIQYAKTSDGVRIACASVGEGRALLLMPFPPMSWLAGWQFNGVPGEWHLYAVVCPEPGESA